jgi:hypothetical protein
MKAIAILGLILFILFSTFVLPRKIQEFRLGQSQESVMVTVKQLPDCSVGYRNKFIHIIYEDKTYIIRTKCKYVESLVKGQTIVMFHKPDTDIFLFPNEDTTTELVTTLLLVVFFAFCVGAFVWKKR